jgi:opacity protein-like surface antigen
LNPNKIIRERIMLNRHLTIMVNNGFDSKAGRSAGCHLVEWAMNNRTLRIFLGASLIAATAGMGPALSADLDSPIFVQEAPEFVPVEIGSGWYLRGDISYTLSDPVYDFTLLGVGTDNMRFGAAGGIGYRFSDWLRGDVNLAFLGSDDFFYDDGTDSGSAAHTAWSGMVHAYADIATVAGFTPYIGGGVGLLRTSNEVVVNAPSIPLAGAIDDTQYRFAYALNAGVSYRMGNNLSLDLGYQYLASPGTQYVDVNTLTVREGVDYHQVRVGLRYDIW